MPCSGSKLRAGEVNDATEDAGVSTEGEEVIERLRRLNDALNKQLQKQSDKIKQQIKDNQRYIYLHILRIDSDSYCMGINPVYVQISSMSAEVKFT